MRETRPSGSEGGGTGTQPALPTPIYRAMDRTFYSESFYSSEVSCSTPTGAPICEGYYLSDAIFGDIEYDTTNIGIHFLALPDISTGRLVETPAEMGQTIDLFIAKGGKIDFNRALVTGYDFLESGAESVGRQYDRAGKTLDSLINNTYTSGQLDALLFSSPPHALNNLNDHCNHYNFGTPAGQPALLSTAYMNANHPGQPFDGALFYTPGCHSGLNLPDADFPSNNPLDLPQLLLRKGAAAYISNTGFGWALHESSGYHALLMDLITQEILSRPSCSLGLALDEARREYYVRCHRYDVFDEKVLLETSLFGLPMFKVVVDSGMVKHEGDMLRADGPSRQETGGISLEKEIVREEKAGIPAGLDEVDLHFSFNASSYNRYDTATGTYYTLNDMSNGEIGDTIQPMFIYDSWLSGTSSHGVMFTGGNYTKEGGFTPNVGVPQSNNEYSGSGPIAPGMGGMIGTIGMTKKSTSSSFAVTEITRLTACTGYWNGGFEYRFSTMDFAYFYSNSSDKTPPVITDPGPGGFHTLSGANANFSVQVSDASGIYRVVVAYTSYLTQWKSFDLAYNGSSGKWEGTLALTRNITYFVQAVDNNGNVGLLMLTGQDLDANNQPYGSDYSNSAIFTTALADSDSDGMPNVWETDHGLNPNLNDASGDPDQDLLQNINEYNFGSDPQDGDSDDDGDNDGSEAHNFRDPLNPADGKALLIKLNLNGGSIDIGWGMGEGSNSVIDGPYWIYRNTSPSFTAGDEMDSSPKPLPDGSISWTDIDPTGAQLYYYSISNVHITAAPLINVVFPFNGPVAGNTSISVYGANFTTGATVKIGGNSCTNVSVVNSTTITCKTPAGTAGPKDVVVRNPNGQQGTLFGGFTYY